MDNSDTVTQLLVDWREGDQHALHRLIPLVYDTLQDLAGRHMRRERVNHTLQPAAVVNEAFSKLIEMQVDWQDQVHFFAVASRLMRRILIDHARAQQRAKRGGGMVMVTLNDIDMPTSGKTATDLVDLNDALEHLEQTDARKCQVIELHFFGGLTYDEIAKVLQISPATVHRELRFAKAWLYRELADDVPPAKKFWPEA